MDSSKFTTGTKVKLNILANFGVCGFSQPYEFDIIAAILTENSISYRFSHGRIIWLFGQDNNTLQLLKSLAA